MKPPKMILLDVDGTLVDSVPDLAYCIDAMMERLGRPPRGEAAVRNWVGNGVERLVQRALTGQLEGEPDAAGFERALPMFLDLYRANTSGRSHLYPGVRDGLDYLKTAGYPLGCVTNKAAEFTEPLLRDLGVRDYFGIVVSGDTLSRHRVTRPSRLRTLSPRRPQTANEVGTQGRPMKTRDPLHQQAIDALYGLEPVFEPDGPGGQNPTEFATVQCPYCGESFETAVDLSAGSFIYVEDCQVCCQPIELAGEADEDGALAVLTASRAS